MLVIKPGYNAEQFISCSGCHILGSTLQSVTNRVGIIPGSTDFYHELLEIAKYYIETLAIHAIAVVYKESI